MGISGFEGRTAVVTGASRGIGRCVALELAKRGANIVFNYAYDEVSALSLQSEISSFGVGAFCRKVNMKNTVDLKNFIECARNRFPKIEFLINNAGIIRDRSLMLMTQEEWDEVIDVNLNGVFRVTRILIPIFLKQGHGNIVTISSTAGIVGSAGQTNYSASKAGLIGFTKALAKEVAAYNVRANVVAPGYIDTDMVKSIPASKREKYVSSVPMKRIGEPEDVAKAVIFLLSSESDYITGHVLPVDGGLAI